MWCCISLRICNIIVGALWMICEKAGLGKKKTCGMRGKISKSDFWCHTTKKHHPFPWMIKQIVHLYNSSPSSCNIPISTIPEGHLIRFHSTLSMIRPPTFLRRQAGLHQDRWPRSPGFHFLLPFWKTDLRHFYPPLDLDFWQWWIRDLLLPVGQNSKSFSSKRWKANHSQAVFHFPYVSYPTWSYYYLREYF